MHVKNKNELASRVLLCDKFAKKEKYLFKRMEPHKKSNRNWWIISGEMMYYTEKEIDKVPE